MNHVFARVTGYGVIFVPIAPFSFRFFEPNTIVVTRFDDDGDKQATIEVDQGKLHVALAEGTADIAEVAELSPSPFQDFWSIVTSFYTIPWPIALELVSGEEGGPSMFDLVGPNGELAWVQGPFELPGLPKPEQLCAPGQTLLKTGTSGEFSWVDFAYEHEGAAWCQRYYGRRHDNGKVLMVTLQVPESVFRKTVECIESAVLALRYPL